MFFTQKIWKVKKITHDLNHDECATVDSQCLESLGYTTLDEL